MNSDRNILYISLTGMGEALGRSQVLEYLVELSGEREICLISFEREKDFDRLDEVRQLTERHGIRWHWLPYSNRYGIFSTLKQLCMGMRVGCRLVKERQIGIVHARSFIPAIMGMLLKKRYSLRLLFDIRGFAVDELVDRKRILKGALLYRVLRCIEDYLYRNADHIVTLTHRAREILDGRFRNGKRITVIPTCANKALFHPLSDSDRAAFKRSLGFDRDDTIIIHTGTVSNWYDFDSEVRLIRALMERDKTIRFLILNRHEHPFIQQVLGKYRLPPERVTVDECSFEAMHRYLNIADVSLFFIIPSYSKQASAPTKFAENVACRLPSITNDNVGDMTYYLQHYRVGSLVSLETLKEDEERTADEVLDYLRRPRSRTEDFAALFEKHFDKDMAVRKYQAIYRKLEEPGL